MRIQRLCLFSVLAFWLGAAHGEFRTTVLNTGPAVSQSVLVVADRIYVFNVDDTGRSYRVGVASNDYALGEKSEPLDESVIFFDSLQTPSGPVAVLLARGEVRSLDKNKQILQFESIYNAPVIDALPYYDAFRDLNGDGLDDFLMPSFDGYQLAIQQTDGSFAKPITLIAPPIMDMSYNSHPWYQAKNIFFADMDLDTRRDLVFWAEDHFVVYPQLATGAFASTAFTVPSSVLLDYDSFDGMSVRMSNQDQSDKTVRVAYGIEDYNGDGISDLMTMEVKSSGVFRKKTTFALHPGRGDIDRHVVFSAQPTSGIESNGIQYEMESRDLDGDGDLDLIVSSVELGVGKIIAALLTSSVKIDLGVYMMRDGLYAQKPDATREITATFSLSSGEFWQPAVLIQDANGDGRADLLLQDGEKFELFLGEASPDLFERKALAIETPMPRDPDLIQTAHINGDGVMDMIMRIPPPLGEPKGQHRVILLVSEP